MSSEDSDAVSSPVHTPQPVIEASRPEGSEMPERTERQQATVTTMIDIAERMALQTQLITRRDVVEAGEVELTDEEDAKLAEALLHIDQAAGDLRRLRGDRTS